MISGEIAITLNKGVKAETFMEKIEDEYSVISVKGSTLRVDYHDAWTNNIEVLLKKREILKAEGELYDDGYDSGNAGSFRVYKVNGKVKYENLVFLSKLSLKELVDELKRRTDEGSYN